MQKQNPTPYGKYGVGFLCDPGGRLLLLTVSRLRSALQRRSKQLQKRPRNEQYEPKERPARQAFF